MVDTIPISDIDINGLTVSKDLKQSLAYQNVKLILAGCQSEIGTGFQQIGEPVENVNESIFHTLRKAVNAFKAL